MKNIFLTLSLCFYFTLVAGVAFATDFVSISGKVYSRAKGLSGVAVTDGKQIVYTDKNGNYSMRTSGDRKFVYYTLPSGYESRVVNGVPVFYDTINTSRPQQVINFELWPAVKPQNKHAFIVWADPQVIDMEEVNSLKEVAADLRKTAQSFQRIPVHAISCGDIVFDRLNLFTEYKSVIATTGLPFYQSLGNHDMDYNERSDELAAVSYERQFGPSYYSFNVGNIHYVTLKNVFYYGFSYRYMGYIDETQLSWLEKDLSKVKKGSTVILTMHIPSNYGESEGANYQTSLSNSVMNRQALYKIMEGYNVHFLAGHSHTQWNRQVAPHILEHVHAAASGAWWQGDVSTDGTPKGYTVYEVDGDSLTWYYKAMGKNKNEQFKLYKAGADTSQPGYFIANVYNYDDAWQVNWYENEKLMGKMTRYWGTDPLAKELYQPGKNKKHSWLSAGSTYHLFKAKPVDKNARIMVKVTDRFGNSYTKNL